MGLKDVCIEGEAIFTLPIKSDQNGIERDTGFEALDAEFR